MILKDFISLRDIKLKQTEEIEHLRTKFEEQAREMDIRYQERYSTLRFEIDIKRFKSTNVRDRYLEYPDSKSDIAQQG